MQSLSKLLLSTTALEDIFFVPKRIYKEQAQTLIRTRGVMTHWR